MKRPAFQFYPADWRKDAAVQACSMAARGLWHEMLCIAHECDPYGHLTVNGAAMTSAQLARLVGEGAKDVQSWLTELEAAGVFSRDDQGRIYSRRMVKDERLRNVRADAGRLGGNPRLVGGKVNQNSNHARNHDANQSGKQSPTPSSSSSSPSSVENQPRGSSASMELPPLPATPTEIGHLSNYLTRRGMDALALRSTKARAVLGDWCRTGVTLVELGAAYDEAERTLQGAPPGSPTYLNVILLRLRSQAQHPQRRTAGDERAATIAAFTTPSAPVERDITADAERVD